MLIEFRWAKGEQMNVCYILYARGRNRVIASPRDVGSGGLITTSLANSRQLLSPTAHVAVRFRVGGDCDGFIRPYALASEGNYVTLLTTITSWAKQYIGTFA